jgi:hypothetical protein
VAERLAVLAYEVLDVGRGAARLVPGAEFCSHASPCRARHPALRLKSVAAQMTWNTRPVPQPDEKPAAESLARTLEKAGLAFRGVEVVAVP